MSVELKVTLVGEDTQQQQAFNNPSVPASTAPSISAPPVQPSQPAQQPVVAPAPAATHNPAAQPATPPQPAAQAAQQPPTASKSTPVPPPLPSWFVQSPPVQGQDQRLIFSIEQLIEAIDRMTASNARSTNGSQSSSTHNRSTHTQTESWFDRIAAKLDKKIDDLGMAHTAVGNLVSHLAHTVSEIGTRVSKFASNAIGSSGTATGQTATTAAGASATQATGQTATTAGSGASASAAPGALAGATGPIVAVALAAGAAALSLKLFMDAIHKTASELEDLSPDIAANRAQHEVNMELARLDRARRIGSDVAGVDHAQHRLSESMYEVQTKIYELLLKAAPAMETGIDLLNVIVRSIEVMISTANNIAAKITPDPTDDAPAAKALADSMKNLNDAWQELLTVSHPHNQGQMDPIFAELLQANPVAGAPRAPKRGGGRP